MSGYLHSKRNRMERLLRGEITLEQYIALVKAEAHAQVKRLLAAQERKA